MREDASDAASYQAKVSTMVKAERDRNATFPVMLHRMLTDIDELGGKDPDMKKLQEIVSWQSHGKSFKIHDKKTFISVVMPVWFIRIKYSSWIRQLNTYGFKKIRDDGPDKGALFHESFVRSMPELAVEVKKNTKKKKQDGAADEPVKPERCPVRLPKVEGSGLVHQFAPIGNRYPAGATHHHDQQRLSHPPMALQARDALLSSILASGPLDTTYNASSAAMPDRTFGRVWHLLDESNADCHLSIPDVDVIGLADFEPLPFATELTVAEKLGDLNPQFMAL